AKGSIRNLAWVRGCSAHRAGNCPSPQPSPRSAALRGAREHTAFAARSWSRRADSLLTPAFRSFPIRATVFCRLSTGLAPRGHRLQSAKPPLVIGTRGSPLALAQAKEVRDRLSAAHALAAGAITLEAIHTTGDMIRDRPLAEEGGKGLFTKELDQALLAGAVDLAVHSAKDMPTFLPAGLAIAAVLPREDARDVFIGRAAKTLAELPRGAHVGTSSPRRSALIKRL